MLKTITEYMGLLTKLAKKYQITAIVLHEHEDLIRNEFNDYKNKTYAGSEGELEEKFVNSLENPSVVIRSLASGPKKVFLGSKVLLLVFRINIEKKDLNFRISSNIFHIFSLLLTLLFIMFIFIQRFTNAPTIGYYLSWIIAVVLFVILLFRCVLDIRTNTNFEQTKLRLFNLILQVYFYFSLLLVMLNIFYIFNFAKVYISKNIHSSIFTTGQYTSAFILWLFFMIGYILNLFLVNERTNKNSILFKKIYKSKFMFLPVNLLYIFSISLILKIFGNVPILTYIMILFNIITNWIISLGFLFVYSFFLYPVYFLILFLSHFKVYRPNFTSS